MSALHRSTLWLAVVLTLLPAQALAAIPQVEREALIALYNSTNGPGWNWSTGWLGPPGTECSWLGVLCDAGETTVVRISLGGNSLQGDLPPELGNLASLQTLDLSFNQLTSIPPELGSLGSLVDLDLRLNQLSNIPPELGNLPSLQTLDLTYNQLTSIPAEVGSLASLLDLGLGLNQLTSIPRELGNLPSLRELHLDDNKLGSIPRDLGNLVSLQWLYLDGNQLNGIPAELGNLASLRVLYLNYNQLTSIPPELGNLAWLQVLILQGNQLSSIPPELGSLLSLLDLSLSRNRIVGSLPTTLMNLSQLGSLGLRWNAAYTNDPGLKAFLDARDPYWESTQTIAPAGVSVGAPTGTSITLTWTSIVYTQDSGGYRLYVSTASGGPYSFFGITADKTASAITVTGLAPATTYFFVVQTQTDSHLNNENTVLSEPSTEVAGTTDSAACPGTFITLAPAALPAGTVGVPYSQAINASGGTPPYTLAVTAGVLPPGLSGTLSGIPTEAGAFRFTVTATDAASCTGSQSYVLVIVEPGVDYVAGEGAGPSSTNRVRAYRGDGTATAVDFQAYGAGRWGTLVSSGDIAGSSAWEILTGPGPGPVYGPQVRGFQQDGAPMAKVSYYAYSTLRYGVNVGASDIDGDGFEEILSGPGPGAVFGPHVRGWSFDGVTLTAMGKVSFFAYSTVKYGVNVEDGEMDADGFGEILTGAGPGQMFTPHVRGFDYDGASVAPVAGINFIAYGSLRYGVNVAGGDANADGLAEIVTAPGAGPFNTAWLKGFSVMPLTPLQGFEAYPFATLFGGRVGLGDVSGDGRWDPIAGAGPDPSAGSTVRTFGYDGFLLLETGPAFAPFGAAGYGVNVGAGALGW